MVAQALRGKGDLTGCGLHGDSLASIVLTGQSNIAVCFQMKHFPSCFKCFFFGFFVVVYIIVEQRRISGRLHQV